MLLFLLIKLVSSWTPVASRYNVDNLPGTTSVIVENKEIVAWKNPVSNQYVIQDNICPHRLAPLSEGEVLENGNIMCAYHGWEMDSRGNIDNIPQANTGIDSGNIKLHPCKLRTYPVHITGDVIWADLEKPTNIETVPPRNPVLDICGPVHEREVPYSIDFLLENFFDPAHVPWVHAGMQGVRSDAGPINMRQVNFDKDNLSVSFRDQVNGDEREGLMTLKNKYVYSLYKMGTYGWENDMTILCIPVCAGRTRIMMCSDNSNTTPEERVAAHKYTNAFFNTDDYLVHKQELIARRNKKKYYTPTNSDYGTRRVRQWVKMFYPEWEYSGAEIEELSKDQATHNFRNHEQFCGDCYRVLKTQDFNIE